jgi:hypothetical protein
MEGKKGGKEEKTEPQQPSNLPADGPIGKIKTW